MVGILICFIFASIISIVWVRLIDNMKNNHPDYKGEDFLNWDDTDMKKNSETDDWDDNKFHTEESFN